MSKQKIKRLSTLYSDLYLKHKVKKALHNLVYEHYKNSTLRKQAPVKKGVPPIIILGMHRSGTSLTSRLIRTSGVYMGRIRGADTDESLFFQNLNDAIFSKAHAYWDEPEALERALNNDTIKNAMVSALTEYCDSKNLVASYLKRRDSECDSIFSIPYLWGWKDPRTCYTLPLWLRVFPNAKVLYIHRNGIDVAQSLVRRNEKMLLSQQSSLRCTSLEGAFNLWEMYNSKCLENIKRLNNKQLHCIKYEELIEIPAATMKSTLQFVGIPNSEEKISEVIRNIQPGKANAFLEDEKLRGFYERVKDSRLMREFGYSDIL